MNEGGQSSTGQLIDFMIKTHPAYPHLQQISKEQGKNMFDVLGEKLEEMRVARGCETLTHLTRDLHLYPDVSRDASSSPLLLFLADPLHPLAAQLHGNRSPLADPRMVSAASSYPCCPDPADHAASPHRLQRGMLTGMALDSNLSDLALIFNATLEVRMARLLLGKGPRTRLTRSPSAPSPRSQAISLQTRHILEEMNTKGHKVDSIYMSGACRRQAPCAPAPFWPAQPTDPLALHNRASTGGQVKNVRLMSILSSICRVPVVLPPSSSAAVVSGSAMLGRYAAEVREVLGGKSITTMAQAKEAGKHMKERLWEIMVRADRPVSALRVRRSGPG